MIVLIKKNEDKRESDDSKIIFLGDKNCLGSVDLARLNYLAYEKKSSGILLDLTSQYASFVTY